MKKLNNIWRRIVILGAGMIFIAFMMIGFLIGIFLIPVWILVWTMTGWWYFDWWEGIPCSDLWEKLLD